MTVSTTTVLSGPYTPDGVVTTFAYNFMAISADEIAVFSRLDDMDTPITSGWTASGLGTGSGNVIFATAPAEALGALYVAAAPSFRQGLVLANGGAFYGPSIEQAFDRGVMRDQVLKDQVSRAVVVPLGEQGQQLPSAAVRANSIVGFDVNGDYTAVRVPYQPPSGVWTPDDSLIYDAGAWG